MKCSSVSELSRSVAIRNTTSLALNVCLLIFSHSSLLLSPCGNYVNVSSYSGSVRHISKMSDMESFVRSRWLFCATLQVVSSCKMFFSHCPCEFLQAVGNSARQNLCPVEGNRNRFFLFMSSGQSRAAAQCNHSIVSFSFPHKYLVLYLFPAISSTQSRKFHCLKMWWEWTMASTIAVGFLNDTEVDLMLQYVHVPSSKHGQKNPVPMPVISEYNTKYDIKGRDEVLLELSWIRHSCRLHIFW